MDQTQNICNIKMSWVMHKNRFFKTSAKVLGDQGNKRLTYNCQLCLRRLLSLEIHSMTFICARVNLLYWCDEQVIPEILDSSPIHHILFPTTCHCNKTCTNMKHLATTSRCMKQSVTNTGHEKRQQDNFSIRSRKSLRSEGCMLTHTTAITTVQYTGLF